MSTQPCIRVTPLPESFEALQKANWRDGIEIVHLPSDHEAFKSTTIQILPSQLDLENGGIPFRIFRSPINPVPASEDIDRVRCITYFAHALGKDISLKQFEILNGFNQGARGMGVEFVSFDSVQAILTEDGDQPRTVLGKITGREYAIDYCQQHLDDFFEAYSENAGLAEEVQPLGPGPGESEWRSVTVPDYLKVNEIAHIKRIIGDNLDRTLNELIAATKRVRPSNTKKLATSLRRKGYKRETGVHRTSRSMRNSRFFRTPASGVNSIRIKKARLSSGRAPADAGNVTVTGAVPRKSAKSRPPEKIFRSKHSKSMTWAERTEIYRMTMEQIHGGGEVREEILGYLLAHAPKLYHSVRATSSFNIGNVPNSMFRTLSNIVKRSERAEDIDIDVKQEELTPSMVEFTKNHIGLLPVERQQELRDICARIVPRQSPNLLAGQRPKLTEYSENVQIFIHKYITKHLLEPDTSKAEDPNDEAMF